MPPRTARRRPVRSRLAGCLPALLLALATSVPLVAAPPPAAAHAAGETASGNRVPVEVSPEPQSVVRHGGDITLPGRVRLVVGRGTDGPARKAVAGVLRGAGVRVVAGPGAAPLTVYVGGPGRNAGVLRGLGVRGPRGLPSGGYVLATGRGHGRAGRVVLSGVDAAGTYYAAQTFRQLVRHRGGRAVLPGVTVRDWPALPRRGVVEGFYGAPWSQRDRLRQLDFYGAHKMNTYVYAPKDDPYSREKWRTPYPAQQLAQLGALERRAVARHVGFVFAVSPGLDVCYSDPGDLKALEAKAAELWGVGVRSFGLFFDDVDGSLHCARDQAAFGGDASPAAAGQAHLLNAFQRDFLDRRAGAGRLLTVPAEYSGTGTSPYRGRFAELVTGKAVLFWTGTAVVSPTVTDADADAARAVFRHDLVLWDNYPVNDYLPRQMFLGPLTGRSPDLAAHGIVGLTANPMPQAEPSKVALATVADYAWSPGRYDAQRSWRAALRDVGGPARDALRAFADNSRSSALDPVESPRLSALIGAFWREHRAGRDGPATAALIGEFTALENAERDLRDRMGDPAFVAEAGPWLTKLHWYGAAGAAAVRSLAAQTDGDGTAAWRERVAGVRAEQTARETYETLATGVVGPFLDQAAAASRVVSVDAPAAAPAGSDVVLSAQVRAGDVPVRKVEFYAGPRKVGEATAAPYRITWRSAPAGLHLVTARAVAADGSAVTSSAARLTSGDPRPVLLLTGDDAPIPAGQTLSTGDAAVRDRLEYLGYPVVTGKGVDSVPSDADGKAAVVISSTLSSGSVGSKFRDAAVPVLTWEAYVLDDMGMAANPGETFRVSQVDVTGTGSALAAGLSGVVPVYRGADRVRWGTPAPAAETAAVAVDDPAHATLFGYRTGARMLGLTAPAPRVALFLGDEGLDPDVVTDQGVRLFDAAVGWALGGA
jgi:beta-N-acetylglucosaminidase/Glycosyl hydrolase family 20, domain 2/Bacterial Ig domain